MRIIENNFIYALLIQKTFRYLHRRTNLKGSDASKRAGFFVPEIQLIENMAMPYHEPFGAV